jgi:hypothetical protein
MQGLIEVDFFYFFALHEALDHHWVLWGILKHHFFWMSSKVSKPYLSLILIIEIVVVFSVIDIFVAFLLVLKLHLLLVRSVVLVS